MSTTRVSRRILAPRAAVYRALIDPSAIPHWKVPDGMTCEVHAFEAREGGTFRISLTYDQPSRQTKAPSFTPFTRAYQMVCPHPTMNWAGRCRLESWQRLWRGVDSGAQAWQYNHPLHHVRQLDCPDS